MSIAAADITDTTNLLVRDIHDPVYHSPDVWLVLLYSPFHFWVGIYHFRLKVGTYTQYVNIYSSFKCLRSRYELCSLLVYTFVDKLPHI